ncbi:MAG: YciI family protein [Hyphomicrobiaceae bacterium]|nr:YciI family protein [Hyphomicrobiaceae bacterium]
MRFMSIVSAPPSSYGQPTPALMEAIGKLSEREIASGRMIDTGGLVPLEQGARVSVRKGEVVVQDGPFTEAKEVIGGYAIFELQNAEEALALAVEFMQLHKDHMPGWEGTCEVRALFADPQCC